MISSCFFLNILLLNLLVFLIGRIINHSFCKDHSFCSNCYAFRLSLFALAQLMFKEIVDAVGDSAIVTSRMLPKTIIFPEQKGRWGKIIR